MDYMTEYDINTSQIRRTRAMLARFKSFSRWREDQQPSPEMAQLWLALVCRAMALAALTPDEARLVKNVLELDEATAFMEANNVGA